MATARIYKLCCDSPCIRSESTHLYGCGNERMYTRLQKFDWQTNKRQKYHFKVAHMRTTTGLPRLSYFLAESPNFSSRVAQSGNTKTNDFESFLWVRRDPLELRFSHEYLYITRRISTDIMWPKFYKQGLNQTRREFGLAKGYLGHCNKFVATACFTAVYD